MGQENERYSHNHTAGIVFNDDRQNFEQLQRQKYGARDHNQPKVTQFFIKYSGGFIKTNQGAEIIMVIISLVCILCALFVFFKASTAGDPKELEIIAPEGEIIVHPRNAPPHLR